MQQLLTIFVLLVMSACVCHGGKFVMINGSFTYEQGNRECGNRGMKVAVIYSMGEHNEAIKATKKSDHPGCASTDGHEECRALIAYQRINKTSNIFIWINGQSTFTYFLTGQPDNFNGNESCVEMNFYGKWNDVQCNEGISVLCERVSLAEHKQAEQNTTEWGGDANRAVDGNRNGFYFSGHSCSHTSLNGPHVWTVDLAGFFFIGDVRITNRQDPCCAGRLKYLDILVEEDPSVARIGTILLYKCATFTGPLPQGETSLTISCDGHFGRKVSIVKRKESVLTLCEVEVFRAAPEIEKIPTQKGNLALQMYARQSSTDRGGVPSRALDGNRNGFRDASDSCTRTLATGLNFWVVDLGKNYSIGDIRISGFRDCCADYFTNLDFYVTGDKAVESSDGNDAYKCATYTGPPRPPLTEVKVSCGGYLGHFVSILRNIEGPLSFCEVEVFKYKV